MKNVTYNGLEKYLKKKIETNFSLLVPIEYKDTLTNFVKDYCKEGLYSARITLDIILQQKYVLPIHARFSREYCFRKNSEKECEHQLKKLIQIVDRIR